MKLTIILMAINVLAVCVCAQNWTIPTNAAIELPPGVPKVVDTNGNVVNIDSDFTTTLYRDEALKLVLAEANQIAIDLNFTNEFPVETNLAMFYISPFGFAYGFKMVGNVSTKHYTYYISRDSKLSFVEGTHQFEDCVEYKKRYTWSTNKMDKQLAFQQATQWLSAAHMDVAALNRDCDVFVLPENTYIQSPPGKFVPVYYVYWKPKNGEGLGAAEVRLFTPTRRLLSLRVEDPKYILRKPLVFTNLAALFPGIAPVITNYPKEPILIDGGRR